MSQVPLTFTSFLSMGSACFVVLSLDHSCDVIWWLWTRGGRHKWPVGYMDEIQTSQWFPHASQPQHHPQGTSKDRLSGLVPVGLQSFILTMYPKWFLLVARLANQRTKWFILTRHWERDCKLIFHRPDRRGFFGVGFVLFCFLPVAFCCCCYLVLVANV